MINKRFFSYVFFLLSLLTGASFAQPIIKGKEAFSKGDFPKAIKLYEKGIKSLSENSKEYQYAQYSLAEAYRLDGNYVMADSIHSQLDFTQMSYWGYALTMMQQYRIDKCYNFAKQQLKFDPLQPELLRIVKACELNRKQIDESKIVVKPLPIPKGKKSIIAPGFIVGNISNNELVARLPQYVGLKKEKVEKNYAPYPIILSGIMLKEKEEKAFTITNSAKLGYSLSNRFFDYYLNPAYYTSYRSALEELTLNDPNITKVDTVKPSEYKLIPVFSNQEIVKQAWISMDRNIIVFSSNKMKGEGGYDLFMSSLGSNGWSNPQNMGLKINTPGNEINPFISSKGTLYFSSNGRDGHGGYDIYSHNMNHLDSSEVENLPKPYNSAFDDYAFVYHDVSGFGFFASSRPNGIISSNIFQFENRMKDCIASEVFKEVRIIKSKCDESQFCRFVDFLRDRDSTSGANFNYMCETGDGKKERGLRFRHCYEKPGKYTVRLYKVDPSGNKLDSATAVKNIVIEEKDYLDYEREIDYNKTEFTAINSVCKKCQGVNYYWDFGDGSMDCGSTVKHTYKAAGSYKVRVVMKFRKDKEEKRISCTDVIRIETP